MFSIAFAAGLPGAWMHVFKEAQAHSGFRLCCRPLVWIKSELLQQHTGHVTIVPTLTTTTLFNALTNPSHKILRWFSREGARAVYPYMHVIELRCRVERALHDSTRRVRSSLRSPRPSPYASAYVSPLPGRRSMGSGGRTGPGSPIPWSTVQPTDASRIPPRRRSPPPTSPSLSRKSSSRTLLSEPNAPGWGGSFQLDTLTVDNDAAAATSTPGARALTALSSDSASLNASLSSVNSPSMNASLSPASSPVVGGFQSRLARQSGRDSLTRSEGFSFPDEDVD